MLRVGAAAAIDRTNHSFFPKKRTGKETDPCWPPLSWEAALNRFPVSIIPKSKLEKRQTQVSDRPSQKDRVVSFAKSKRAFMPKKVMLLRARKNIIYLYSYINIQRDQMLFYHWFTQCSSFWSKACWEPFASSFSVLFTDLVLNFLCIDDLFSQAAPSLHTVIYEGTKWWWNMESKNKYHR